MERYNFAIQVSDNVTDVMDLPCVMRCDKLVIGAGGMNAVGRWNECSTIPLHACRRTGGCDL